MDIQRLRNLTTGRLHTDIGHVYQDIEFLTGAEGIMTHMLPNACRALEPFLREKASDPRLWNDEWDPNHTGEIEVPQMNETEQACFWAAYSALRSPLEGKKLIAVSV